MSSRLGVSSVIESPLVWFGFGLTFRMLICSRMSSCIVFHTSNNVDRVEIDDSNSYSSGPIYLEFKFNITFMLSVCSRLKIQGIRRIVLQKLRIGHEGYTLFLVSDMLVEDFYHHCKSLYCSSIFQYTFSQFNNDSWFTTYTDDKDPRLTCR